MTDEDDGDGAPAPSAASEVPGTGVEPDGFDGDGEPDAGEPDGGESGPASAPMSRFRHGSIGVTLGAAMTGLGNVLEPRKKEETSVVIQHDEPDHSHDAVELRLVRDDPAASVVIIRKPHEE